jgi:hypothetical protein
MKQQKLTSKSLILLVSVLHLFSISSLQANPSFARNANVHVDYKGNLIPPDQHYFERAIKYYKKEKKLTAIQNFTFAAEFGNKTAIKYIGLMYLQGDGIPKEMLKGIAWTKLSADFGDPKSSKVSKQFFETLSVNEIDQVETIYKNLKENYGNEAVLKNIFKFKRRFRFQTLGKPNTIKYQGKYIALNPLQFDRLEIQIQKYYTEFKKNLGTVTQGDIIIKED